MNKSVALEKLRRQQAAIDAVPPDGSAPEFKKWKRDTEVAISNVFQDDKHLKEFAKIQYGLTVFFSNTPESAWRDACKSGLDHARAMLQSMIDEVEEYWTESDAAESAGNASGPMALLESLRNINDLAYKDEVGLDAWRGRTRMAIRHTFGDTSPYLGEVTHVGSQFHTPIEAAADQYRRECWNNGKAMALNLVERMIEEVTLRGSTPPAGVHTVNVEDVFVVHGHDDAMKLAVCRALEKLGLKPIVLHEQPNRGQTIIEKFTGHAIVGFAVVLLSPDDVGAERGKEPLRPRARQNVVLELGFFLGSLGRERVLPLVRQIEQFELPSDYVGVVFTPFDEAGRWELELVRELKAAGYDVDANRLFA